VEGRRWAWGVGESKQEFDYMKRGILRKYGYSICKKARKSSNYIATKPLIHNTYLLTLNLCG
jgi:hypothetical protein